MSKDLKMMCELISGFGCTDGVAAVGVIWRREVILRRLRAFTIRNLRIQVPWVEIPRRCTAPLLKRPIAGKLMGDPLTLYFKRAALYSQCWHVPFLNAHNDVEMLTTFDEWWIVWYLLHANVYFFLKLLLLNSFCVSNNKEKRQPCRNSLWIEFETVPTWRSFLDLGDQWKLIFEMECLAFLYFAIVFLWSNNVWLWYEKNESRYKKKSYLLWEIKKKKYLEKKHCFSLDCWSFFLALWRKLMICSFRFFFFFIVRFQTKGTRSNEALE